jgi:small multidrug resistance pump
MIIVAAAMSAVGIVGDYFLKRASGEASPLATPTFLVGLALYSSTAFVWVFVMRFLKLVTIGVIYSVCMILMLTVMLTTPLILDVAKSVREGRALA